MSPRKASKPALPVGFPIFSCLLSDGPRVRVPAAKGARDFYSEACRTPGFVEAETVHASPCISHVSSMYLSRTCMILNLLMLHAQGPGDVTFVPRGWWHMVLNVAPLTIAVSHHFLSPAGLHSTLRLLRDTPQQVSGIDRGLKRDAESATDADADATTAATAVPALRAAASAATATATATASAAASAATSAAASDAHAAVAVDDDDARRKAAGVALHDRLVAALRARRPEALEAAEAILKEEDARRGPRGPTVLKQLVAPSASPEASFTFNFG